MTTPTPKNQESPSTVVAAANDPDRALVILAEPNLAYKLDQDDWQIDEFAGQISPGDQGIVNQLDSFGSLLAHVEKDRASTTFVNQRAILKLANIDASQSKAQVSTHAPESPDEQTLTVLGDDGRVYTLLGSDWKRDEFLLNTENGSDRIAQKLADLGSYVAFVRKDVALQVGACCIVINLRAVLADHAQQARQSMAAASR